MSGLRPHVRAALGRWRWWAALVALVALGAVITWIAYVEGLDMRPLPQFDKLVHFAFSGLLAFLLDGALGRANAGTAWGKPVPVAALLVLVPRGLEEVAQAFSVWRTASIFDWLADVAGVVTFAIVARRLAARRATAQP